MWGFADSDAYIWGGVAYTFASYLLYGYLLSTIVVTFIRAKSPVGTQRMSDEVFLRAAAASSKALLSGSGRVLDTATAGSAHTLDAAISKEAAAPNSAQDLPFVPATLTFTDVGYSVTLKKGGDKALLVGVSGAFTPGKMIALMGASGAGKTTLLDVLGGRKTVGKITGQMHINGAPMDHNLFMRVSAFAEQEDVHADYSTVREAIAFSASMRLPASLTSSQRSAFVDYVLSLLELTPIANYRTGSLSLGERKRLTIAVELAANPTVLFLDEPTTGLDARSAAIVVRVIRKIASTGRTVVATVHQPNAEVFFSFDALLCLVPGGKTAYWGPLGAEATTLVSFLSGLPNSVPLPRNVNPATWMLEQMARNSGAPAPSPVDAEAPVPASVVTAYTASPIAAESTATLTKLHTATSDDTVQVSAMAAAARPAFGSQLVALTMRMSAYQWRNTTWTGLRLVVLPALALFFGLLYRNSSSDTEGGLFGLLAVALNGLLFCSIISLNTATPNLSRLRAPFYREVSAGTYHPSAWPLAIFASELVWSAFFVLMFQSIIYFLVGYLAEPGPFFTAYLVALFVAIFFSTLGAGFIAFFPVPLLADIAGGITIQLCILFAGVQLSYSQLPSGWRWMYTADAFSQ